MITQQLVQLCQTQSDLAELTSIKIISDKVLCYIVYGEDMMYYQGVKVSILSFFAHLNINEYPLIVVLSEKPEYFKEWSISPNLNLLALTLTPQMIESWTKDNYHYRIKTMGLAYIISILHQHHWVNDHSKFLFFDSDTYFPINPLPLYDNITPTQVVMYKQEPKIFGHKKYRNYVNGLANKTINYDDNGVQKHYQLLPNAQMYSSLIMGVLPTMLDQLYQASQLMYPMRELTNARTVEQFAFVEIMKQHYQIYQGKQYVKHYSRRRQKAFVEKQLIKFWQDYPKLEQQLKAIHLIKFTRPWYLVLGQALKRIVKPEHIR